jgi:hypothetical protein
MSDLRTLLHEAAPLAVDTSDALVESDLARAHRALRRRRARRLGTAGGLVAATAVAALVLTAPDGRPTATRAEGTTSPRSSAVELVAYEGPQPAGFTLDTVPRGWAVRDSTTGLLTLAPRGSVAPSTPDGMTSLVGTIAVSVQSDTGVPTGVRLDDVRVAGHPAVIAHLEGAGDTRTLFVRQSSGAYLTIQVWDGLGWDNRRIAEFAASVHITDDATPSVG